MASRSPQSWRSLPVDRINRGIATLALVALILITVTRLSVLQGDVLQLPEMQGQGSALRQGAFLLCTLLMLVAIRPLSYPRKLLDLPASLLVLLAWLLASMTWSIAPDIGLRRLALALIVIWLAFRTVDELGYRRSMDVLVYVMSVLLLVNLAAVAVTPRAVHLGLDLLQDPSIIGTWRGILSDKNAAGLATAVTILLLALGAGRFPLLLRLALIGIAAVFLAGTYSRTSMGVIGVALVAAMLFRLYNPRYRVLLIPLAVMIVAGLIYALAVYLPPFLQELSSSREAFTGRVEIWRALLGYIGDYPWTGAGYQTFWNVGAESPVNRYTNVRWIIVMESSGHDGYLDLATQIGIPGLILALIVLFFVPIARLLVGRGVPRGAGALQVALLVFMLIHNVTESTVLVPDQFGELVLMLAIAGVRDIRRRTDPDATATRDRRPRVRPLAGAAPLPRSQALVLPR